MSQDKILAVKNLGNSVHTSSFGGPMHCNALKNLGNFHSWYYTMKNSYEIVVYVNIFKFECDFKIIFDQLNLTHLSLLLKVKHTDTVSLADRKIHFDRENLY